MERDGQRDCAQEPVGAACLAQLGRLLPPFKPLRPEIIAALLPLTRSEAADKPIPLNQAIVVQIWLIFFGSEACTELADAGPAGFYRALGALRLGSW